MSSIVCDIPLLNNKRIDKCDQLITAVTKSTTYC